MEIERQLFNCNQQSVEITSPYNNDDPNCNFDGSILPILPHRTVKVYLIGNLFQFADVTSSPAGNSNALADGTRSVPATLKRILEHLLNRRGGRANRDGSAHTRESAATSFRPTARFYNCHKKSEAMTYR
jgi:hypothetical protein